jgi:uncharacterized HAD superfamily protein
MLELGRSKPWKDAMEVMTGQGEMSTSAFREYFKPLEDWLIKENAKNNVKVGWKIPLIEEMCSSKSQSGASASIPVLATNIKAQMPLNEEEQKALQFVTKSEAQLEKVTQNYIALEWAYESNITDYNEKRKLEYKVLYKVANSIICVLFERRSSV